MFEEDKETVRPGSSSPPNVLLDGDADDDEGDQFVYGDYSAQIDEILSSNSDLDVEVNGQIISDEDEDNFVYHGAENSEVNSSAGYRAQLRGVLGDSASESEHEDSVDGLKAQEDEIQQIRNALPSRVQTPPSKRLKQSRRRSHLDPHISRLRSYNSPAPLQHRLSTYSTLSYASSASGSSVALSKRNEIFRFTHLPLPSKNQSGALTTMACSGRLCVGSSDGKVNIYDFYGQKMCCICSPVTKGKDLGDVGAVTALALSQDQSFVAVGHNSGHIFLYNIMNPSKQSPTPVVPPSRHLPPHSLKSIVPGKVEGHLAYPITHIRFLGTRNTAIVSADAQGLSFEHSLGRVLWVDATDVVRVLGRYPTSSSPSTPVGDSKILDLAPLPLGVHPHPLDVFSLVSIITPRKVLLVGLKPEGRTWWRERFEQDSAMDSGGCLAWWPGHTPPQRPASSKKSATKAQDEPSKTLDRDTRLLFTRGPNFTLLSVTCSQSSHLVDDERRVVKGRVEVSVIRRWTSHAPIDDQIDVDVFLDVPAGGESVLSIQWLNSTLVLALTQTYLSVYDVRNGQRVDGCTINVLGIGISSSAITKVFSNGVSRANGGTTPVPMVMRTYKSKIFLLNEKGIHAGAVLSWADRVLEMVGRGEMLEACESVREWFELVLSTHSTKAPPSAEAHDSVTNPCLALPKSPAPLAQKLHALLRASSSYLFSPDRLKDIQHIGQGVDRTKVYEGLVGVAVKGCLALARGSEILPELDSGADDIEWLYDAVYEQYSAWGLEPIFLDQLLPFVIGDQLDGYPLPARLSGELLKFVAAKSEKHQRPILTPSHSMTLSVSTPILTPASEDAPIYPPSAEQLIWHLHPSTMDIDLCVSLCRAGGWWDALLYVYWAALDDWTIGPQEIMLLLADQEDDKSATGASDGVSYSLFAYLTSILSGLAYPSQRPLPPPDAVRAKQAVWEFLIFGEQSVSGQDHSRLHPHRRKTYENMRFLLALDSEAFLHVLDIAFQDSILNGEQSPTSRRSGRTVTRLVVVKVLLEIISDPSRDDSSEEESAEGDQLSLSVEDQTFIRIFIARNLPKYPQYLYLIPDSGRLSILEGLSTPEETYTGQDDTYQNSKEDRQLAVEYLLSSFRVPPGETTAHVEALFRAAGFYRLLRTWLRQEACWSALLDTFFEDPEYDDSGELVDRVWEVFSGTPPRHLAELSRRILHGDFAGKSYLSRMLDCSAEELAGFVERWLPDQHEAVLTYIANQGPTQFTYLRALLEPPLSSKPATACHLNAQHRHLYIRLVCRYNQRGLISALQHTLEQENTVDDDEMWETMEGICEEEGGYGAVLWILDRRHQSEKAFRQLHTFGKLMTDRFLDRSNSESVADFLASFNDLKDVVIGICTRHSTESTTKEEHSNRMQVEEMWFIALANQIEIVQAISNSLLPETSEAHLSSAGFSESSIRQMLVSLREGVQQTFTNLIAVGSQTPNGSTTTLAFPRLFKRLVASTSLSATANKASYAEFRTILTSMLDSYRFEEDVLNTTARLLERDLCDALTGLQAAQNRGWRMQQVSVCQVCKRDIIDLKSPNLRSTGEVTLHRDGTAYHKDCFPHAVLAT